MLGPVGIDSDLAQRRLVQLIDSCDEIRRDEFVFMDFAALGLAVTAAFDRAAHDYSWSSVQVVSGTSSILMAGCESMASTLSAIGELDADIADRLVQVRSELEIAGAP